MSATDGFHVERIGNTLVVTLGSRIGSLAGAELVRQRQLLVDEIRRPDVFGIVVDFRCVEHFGSFVLDTLCVVWKFLRERAGEMSLCNLSEIAREVVNKSRLNSLWPIYNSLEDALDAQTGGEIDEFDEIAVFDAACDSKYIPCYRDDRLDRLTVIEAGPRTMVAFAEGNLPPEHVAGRYLDQIERLIDEHHCREFAFDMRGVTQVPSGFLGVVSTILRKGVQVSLQNPSVEVREVFEISNLEHSVHLCSVE